MSISPSAMINNVPSTALSSLIGTSNAANADLDSPYLVVASSYQRCSHQALHVTSMRTTTVTTYDYNVDVDVDRHRHKLPQPPMKPNHGFAEDCQSRPDGNREGHGPPPLLSIIYQCQCIPLRRSTMSLLPPYLPL